MPGLHALCSVFDTGFDRDWRIIDFANDAWYAAGPLLPLPAGDAQTCGPRGRCASPRVSCSSQEMLSRKAQGPHSPRYHFIHGVAHSEATSMTVSPLVTCHEYAWRGQDCNDETICEAHIIDDVSLPVVCTFCCCQVTLRHGFVMAKKISFSLKLL